MNNTDILQPGMPGFGETTAMPDISPIHMFSKLFGAAVSLRKALYSKDILKMRSIDAFVISVGNITVGGTGKTPTVIYIAKLLQKHGYKVCVLSRGYKGKNSKKILEVSNDKEVLSDSEMAGDEPYMMAKKLIGIPVIVGKNRYTAGLFAVEKYKPDVCILDDGFQHFKLERDLDIVTFDGNVGFGNGKLLPGGILREPPSALERADVILINKGVKKSKDIIAKVMENGGERHTFFCSYNTVGLTSCGGEHKDIEYISGRRVLVFSALADSNYFYEIITRLGGFICEQIEYKDHHSYDIDDYLTIVKRAHDSSADLMLTTEKDLVKFDLEWSRTSTIKLYSLDVLLKPLDFDDMFEH